PQFLYSLSCLSWGPLQTPLDKRADRGSENVPGISSHKQSILNVGGNNLDLAIAMLETTREYFECVQPNTNSKASQRAYRIMGLYSSIILIILTNVYADVASRWDCQNYYGIDLWFAGHRFGPSGLSNPNTPDTNSIFIPIPVVNIVIQEV
ncbi:hypothetical protein N7453_001503, partial [Penicillium expansum]